MDTIYDLRSKYDRALDDATDLIAAISPDDLRAPTPCDGWDLAALLRHMIGENDGFAVAVAEGDAPPAAYDGSVISMDALMPAWSASVSRLRAAFASPTGAGVHLAELGLTVPVETALRMQLLDTVVHGWDVARSIGRDYRPADDLVEPVLTDARVIAARPGGTPGVFADPVPAAELSPGDPQGPAVDPWDEALRLLGRRP